MMPSKITVKRTVTARNRRFCRNRCGLSMVLLKWRTPDEIAGPHYSCDGCCDAEPQEGYKTGSGAASRKKGENECRDHVGARESYAGQARCKLLDVRRDADDQQQQQDSGQYLRLAEVRQKECIEESGSNAKGSGMMHAVVEDDSRRHEEAEGSRARRVQRDAAEQRKHECLHGQNPCQDGILLFRVHFEPCVTRR